MKRLAIQLFGHLRTFEQTFESFKKNVIETNIADGYEVDIFIHTWDELETSKNTWHSQNSSIAGIQIDENLKSKIISLYQPKKIKIETLNIEHGQALSIDAVSKLREEYEQERKEKYTCIVYTRGDILFNSPLKIDTYLKQYENDVELKEYAPLRGKYIFAGNSGFRRQVLDSRCIQECDLVWFSNYSTKHPYLEKDAIKIPINYIWGKDFTSLRADEFKKNKNKSKKSFFQKLFKGHKK